MKIKMSMIRVENLVNLMKGVRIVEDTEIFSGAFWKSPESIREETRVYYVGVDAYPGLLIDTGRGYIFVRKERMYVGDYTDISDVSENCVDILATPDGGLYAAHLRIEDWTGSDWVQFAFDPSDTDTYPELFTGTFLDACKYVIDWMMY